MAWTHKTIKEILEELKNQEKPKYPKGYVTGDEWEEWLRRKEKDDVHRRK